MENIKKLSEVVPLDGMCDQTENFWNAKVFKKYSSVRVQFLKPLMRRSQNGLCIAPEKGLCGQSGFSATEKKGFVDIR